MSDVKEKDEEKPVVAKTAVDLQRLKLVKLMKNAVSSRVPRISWRLHDFRIEFSNNFHLHCAQDKPIVLPERPKTKGTPSVPEFVRNVMGSSAGAGSGEFHVYRHLRRKEYARQKFIQEKAHKVTITTTRESRKRHTRSKIGKISSRSADKRCSDNVERS